MVSSLTLLIVIPAIFTFLQYSNAKAAEIEENQILRLGSRMAIETQNVFFGGKNSKSTLQERFPGVLKNITFFPYVDRPGGEYVFYLQTKHGLPQSPSIGFGVPVNVQFDETAVNWGAGLKRVVFLAVEDTDGNLYVNVTIQ